MTSIEQVDKAIAAVNDLCGHCPICSPDCPVAISRRALEGLKYDLQSYQKYQEQHKD